MRTAVKSHRVGPRESGPEVMARDLVEHLTTAGLLTRNDGGEFPVSTPDSYPFGITAGPDGNLWFTETLGNSIGRITP